MMAASTGCPCGRPPRRQRGLDHYEDFVVHARPDGIHGQQRNAAWRVLERDRLDEQQLPLRTSGASGWPRPSRQLVRASRFSVPMVHDANDAGVRRHFIEERRKARPFRGTKNTVCPPRHPPRPRRRASARPAVRRRRSAAGSKRPAVQVVVLPCDDHIADHGCKLHQSPADTSTASTIPTIAASTGQSFNPAAIRAELPLTISTVSPTPASTVSTATGRRLLLFRGGPSDARPAACC